MLNVKELVGLKLLISRSFLQELLGWAKEGVCVLNTAHVQVIVTACRMCGRAELSQNSRRGVHSWGGCIEVGSVPV